jgi:NMD protein affecting ribosome stability and mRNA decay
MCNEKYVKVTNKLGLQDDANEVFCRTIASMQNQLSWQKYFGHREIENAEQLVRRSEIKIWGTRADVLVK